VNESEAGFASIYRHNVLLSFCAFSNDDLAQIEKLVNIVKAKVVKPRLSDRLTNHYQNRLGHSDPRMTNRYAHLSNEQLDKTAHRWNGVLALPAPKHEAGFGAKPIQGHKQGHLSQQSHRKISVTELYCQNLCHCWCPR
jgi:hypothetical protein